MVTLVWDIDKPFQKEQLSQLAERYKAEELRIKTQYVQKAWKYHGLNLTLYESTLVIQGDFDSSAKPFIDDMSALNGLRLQSKYARVLASHNPKQNSLMCSSCMKQSMVFECRVEGFNLVFVSECGHLETMYAPFMMFTFRIMPDLNLLISRSMSRLISLGYFTDFQIVIPEFLIDYVDRVKKDKGGISDELKEIRLLESKGKAKLVFLRENITHVTRENANSEEDKVILEIADMTNSILLTSDKNLRERAALDYRPSIFFEVSSFKDVAELARASTESPQV